MASEMKRFGSETLASAAAQREAEFTTYGRRTGRPSSVTIWVSGDGERLFIRSGGGLGRHWPQNLLAGGRGVLKLGESLVPVTARHVSDPAEARLVSEMVTRKYGPSVQRSDDGGPLTPGEQATFELLPE